MSPELPPPIAAGDLRRRILLTAGLAVAGDRLAVEHPADLRRPRPFLFFLPAIILGAAWGGLWPALIIAAIGAANGFLVMRQGESR